ncbi:ATPase [Candidatus Woesearchaeota archaeon]|nr:MoxR family ATPase [Candidatus Woesearchaeota archaeon]RLE41791.1 MAG: ATPase [Candidatus Woesearchaeota archaeon]
MNEKELKKRVLEVSERLDLVKKELSKVVVGQKDVVEGFLRGLISNGHILAEGVPGIAKTLIVRSLSKVMGCEFSRIQFTPDLLPSDIIGITTYIEGEGFQTYKGPIFANFVLADEINRAPPKVQSALLEAMQERQATIGHNTYALPTPFIVMATQNPLETLGTYPLPEAQVDRFLFKLNVVYPSMDEEKLILESNITLRNLEEYDIRSVFDGESIVHMQTIAKEIYLHDRIKEYIVRLVDATRHPEKYNLDIKKYVEWGASPRASIGMYIAAKAEALLRKQTHVIPEFVKKVAPDVLRHRIILNYLAQAEKVTTEDVIDEILKRVKIP